MEIKSIFGAQEIAICDLVVFRSLEDLSNCIVGVGVHTHNGSPESWSYGSISHERILVDRMKHRLETFTRVSRIQKKVESVYGTAAQESTSESVSPYTPKVSIHFFFDI